MNPITENTEFIIGIDFGHGETSACFHNLKNDELKDIDILPGTPTIKSAVAILEQEGVETVCIGDTAFDAHGTKDFQVSFKKRPSEMTPAERNRMVAFMRGVYENILDRHPDYKNRDHRVFIARPSNDRLWKSEESEYIGMAEEAGIPIAGIQKESRAAFFRARTQPDSRIKDIDNQLKNGVLIVDFGSSTIDFTYLKRDKNEPPIDDGINLGASAVEIALMKYALEQSSDTAWSEFNQLYGNKPDSSAYNRLLFGFRKAKEDYYKNKRLQFSFSVDFAQITSAEQQQLVGHHGITLTKKEVREILESEEYGKYIPTIEEAIQKFKDEKLKDQPVSCVYLTGGASRMDFVQELFIKVFNLTEEQCPPDDNPSLIVSQGIANLSYADYKTQEKEKELREIAQKIINSFDWDGKLKETIADSVKKSIIDRVFSLMIDYRDGRIYDYHNLNNGAEGGIDYGVPENGLNGFQKVRNIEALISKFNSTFKGYVNYDFVPQCKNIILNNVIIPIYRELQSCFSTFKYNEELSKEMISLAGLSAKMSEKGSNVLKEKFTAKGNGHVIYDSVWSRNLFMVDWNLKKDRWDNDRKKHFDYYNQNYRNIYSSNSDWNYFIKNYISIYGIPSAKEQISKYMNEMIADYISYAKLTMLY